MLEMATVEDIADLEDALAALSTGDIMNPCSF
jgi:hypothetical protein